MGTGWNGLQTGKAGSTFECTPCHPLAGLGLELKVNIKVLDVREASSEEIAHQHVHGAHGHQH